MPPVFSDIGGDHYSFYVVNQERIWGILSAELKIIMLKKASGMLFIMGIRYI